ncbi:alpha/beta fold hydrolase [Nocardia sp. NBC_01327]|uniref:alpha/beta fold hydrolase n=1 Tax=Nocardia sp. NBC_01327 TaxID=2903593 RepID=UPI002E1130AA|nr:lipase family protein [Nocardia sp. NBC_01327]
MTLRRNLLRLLCTALTALPATSMLAATTSADPGAGIPGFYQQPEPLPVGNPGEVIRSEPVSLTLSVPTFSGPMPGTATRIMFHTTDTHTQPAIATGLILHPRNPWKGPGPQPLVAYLSGTHGQGAQCAPSLQIPGFIQYTPPLDVMAEYELPFLYALLLGGYQVVVPDYQGLGTAGTTAYLNPIAEAHVAIDAVRAAQQLGDPATATGPVLFNGYSQGGQAAGAVAEQLAAYAPELNVKGVVLGAPPVDLRPLLDHLEGGLLIGVSGYILNGLEANYPEAAQQLSTLINPAGRTMMNAVANQCSAETALRYGLHRSSEWTTSGLPLSRVLDDNPVTAGILDDLRLGQHAPSVPILLIIGDNDDIVPAAPARQLAQDWRQRGATVQLVQTNLPTILPGSIIGHGLNLLTTFFTTTLDWMHDRLIES